MKSRIARATLALLCFVFFAAAVDAQIGSYAIANAKIVTVSGSVIPKGTVVIRNGLIESVGANVAVPADAKVFDGNGLTVYPGFIDALAEVGFPAEQQRAPGGQAGRQAQDDSNSVYPDGLRPEVSAADQIKSGEAQFASLRNAGFTTALSIKDSGIFNGQSVLVNLAGDSVPAMVIRSGVAQHVTFRTLRGNYPGSLMGTFAALRQMMLNAKRHAKVLEMYEKEPRGMKRPPSDSSLEALIPVVNGKQPIVFNANTEREIIRALGLAKEFGLNAFIAGGQEAWKVADKLKEMNVPVILSADYPKRTLSDSKEAEPETLDTLRLRAEVPKNPMRLKQAGVTFAFHSGELKNMKDFFANLKESVDAGLSEEDAVRAMTMTPAELFGVEKQLGSIEAGKIANLVVVKGDLFDKDSTITHVFVDGNVFEQPKRPERPARGAGAGAGATANVAGTWNLTVEVPGQSVAATLVLQQQGAAVTGTLSSGLFPATSINKGVARADGFSFSATVFVGGSDITVSFDGKVNGNSVEGTVDSPQGPVAFSGTRNP